MALGTVACPKKLLRMLKIYEETIRVIFASFGCLQDLMEKTKVLRLVLKKNPGAKSFPYLEH